MIAEQQTCQRRLTNLSKVNERGITGIDQEMLFCFRSKVGTIILEKRKTPTISVKKGFGISDGALRIPPYRMGWGKRDIYSVLHTVTFFCPNLLLIVYNVGMVSQSSGPVILYKQTLSVSPLLFKYLFFSSFSFSPLDFS